MLNCCQNHYKYVIKGL